MTVDGEFLHYISPFQFLDSPEWDSLRPTEEGTFQVRTNEAPWFRPQPSKQMSIHYKASTRANRTMYNTHSFDLHLPLDTVHFMHDS